jgi:hypothetical protein
MPREKKEFIQVEFWSNISSTLRTGQGDYIVRCEDRDHPANKIEIPDNVPLYVARHNLATDEYGKYVAYMVVDGKKIIISASSSMKELKVSLSFAMVYSMYAPSIWYRAFRKAKGFTSEVRTPDQKKESEIRGTLAMLTMAAKPTPESSKAIDDLGKKMRKEAGLINT